MDDAGRGAIRAAGDVLDLSPEQRAELDRMRAASRTPEARAEDDRARAMVREEFPPARSADASPRRTMLRDALSRCRSEGRKAAVFLDGTADASAVIRELREMGFGPGDFVAVPAGGSEGIDDPDVRVVIFPSGATVVRI